MFINRLGTRLHFELMVITKVDTINDNVVAQSPNRVLVLFIVRL